LFDWKDIVHKYQDLWKELGEIREHAEESAEMEPEGHSNPARIDPFSLFATYPTRPLTPNTLIERVKDAGIGELKDTVGIGFGQFRTPLRYVSGRLRRYFGCIRGATTSAF
jgi:hypothetical protein